MLTDLFIPFLITALLIELTPGPNMAWLALTSASNGRATGVAAVAGITLGLTVLAVASAVGLAELATQSPTAFRFLRVAGVGYLLWLAWSTWSEEKETSANVAHYKQLAAWFRHGLFLNLLNPKAAVFFMTVLPSYIDPTAPIAPQTVLLSFGYVTIATAIHLFIVIFAGHAHSWLLVGDRKQMIRRIFAGLIALVAIWFLLNSG